MMVAALLFNFVVSIRCCLIFVFWLNDAGEPLLVAHSLSEATLALLAGFLLARNEGLHESQLCKDGGEKRVLNA